MGSADAWATATYRPGAVAFQVGASRGRNLWDEAVAACFWWVGQGSPARERYRLTVIPDAQVVWLDSPDRLVGGVPGRVR